MLHDAVLQAKKKLERGETVKYAEDGESIIIDGCDVADRLIERGRSYKSNVEKKISKEGEKIMSMAEKPKINKASLAMAKRRGASNQRLGQTTGAVKPSTIESIEEHTFQPKLSTSSSSKLGKHRAVVDYYNASASSGSHRLTAVAQRNDAWLQAKAERAEKARVARKALEDAELTFQPKVKSGGKLNTSSAHLQDVRDSPSKFAQRSKVWQNQRERKLQHQRELRQKAELQGHTFAPNLSKKFATKVSTISGGSSKYRDPEDDYDEGGFYAGLAEDRAHRDDIHSNGYEGGGIDSSHSHSQDVQRGRNLPGKSSLYHDQKRLDQKKSRRRSMQEALEELDDFMALENSVTQHESNFDISGINNTNYADADKDYLDNDHDDDNANDDIKIADGFGENHHAYCEGANTLPPGW